jgi:hypothetical protein
MNGELVKRQDRWDLYAEDGSKIGSSAPNPMNKLSLKNCQAIENGYDLDELAVLSTKEETTIVGNQKMAQGFIKGFKKAMELNKDKLFSIINLMSIDDISFEDAICKFQSLQQPKEIEVEIEMENYVKYVPKSLETVYPTGGVRPKLDADGCLILKKK